MYVRYMSFTEWFENYYSFSGDLVIESLSNLKNITRFLADCASVGNFGYSSLECDSSLIFLHHIHVCEIVAYMGKTVLADICFLPAD